MMTMINNKCACSSFRAKRSEVEESNENSNHSKEKCFIVTAIASKSSGWFTPQSQGQLRRLPRPLGTRNDNIIKVYKNKVRADSYEKYK
jgi:hypothetical protein